MKYTILSFVFFQTSAFLFFCTTYPAHAQSFTPLIEGLAPTPGDFSSYLRGLYILAISTAGLLAVGKIILAGIKYVTSGVVTEKQGAKENIRSALIGLLIILAAVALLRTINPGLTNLPALTPAGDLIDWRVVPTCAVWQVDIYGTRRCLSTDTEPDCDISRAGGVCGCNERIIALSTPPYYSCTPLETSTSTSPTSTSTSPTAPSCTFPDGITPSCPTGTVASGTPNPTTGYLTDCECVVRYSFNPATTYRIWDPADPSNGIPADGPNHNQVIQIESIRQEDGVVFYTGSNYGVGCRSVTPPITGCEY